MGAGCTKEEDDIASVGCGGKGREGYLTPSPEHFRRYARQQIALHRARQWGRISPLLEADLHNGERHQQGTG